MTIFSQIVFKVTHQGRESLFVRQGRSHYKCYKTFSINICLDLVVHNITTNTFWKCQANNLPPTHPFLFYFLFFSTYTISATREFP